jgi:uncharacterized repeat protein (TIGR03803 family)
MQNNILPRFACLLGATCATLPAVPAHAWTHATVYTFQGAPDAANPISSLTNLNGTLYGIGRGVSGGGGGTIYSFTPPSSEAVIYSFNNFLNFVGDLTALNGSLYGATWLQGTHNAGSLYGVTFGGSETTLLSYNGPRDKHGAYPQAGMIDVGKTLYGTTLSGGKARSGVVYSLDEGGKYRTLYSFEANDSGGYYPAARLLYQGGMFYGTTEYGGSGPCTQQAGGCGTIFSMTKSGVTTLLYSFAGGEDATYPTSGLIYAKGVFFGTTTTGGKYGGGTVYSYTPGVGEQVLYSFKGSSDGYAPAGELVADHGVLHGITMGGVSGCTDNGCGTVYEVTPWGSHKVLYAFHGGSDGAYPRGALTNVGGVLYGVTSGYIGNGQPISPGTIFSMTR